MKIGLIHATALSMAPISAAFEHHWPAARLVNLLDDSLSRDRAESQSLTQDMFARIQALADYAQRLKVDGVLYTCSAFAEAIQAVANSKNYPVLNPNQSMLSQAVMQYNKIGVISSFAATAKSIHDEFNQLAKKCNRSCHVDTMLEPNAMASLARGEIQQHNELLLQATTSLLLQKPDIEVILLAQYSTSHAKKLITENINQPVLTPCDSAVLELKKRLQK